MAAISHAPVFQVPDHSGDELPPAARRALWVGVAVAHLAGGWALMQVQAVREAVGEVAPIMVDLIAAPTPPKPAPPPPPPPAAPKIRPKAPPTPAPIVTAAPSPAPAPFVAPPPPAEPPAPEQVIVANPSPPAPPAPPAPQPKTVPATAVRYLVKPEPVYPATSQRLRETGRVVVKLLIDEKGVPRQFVVQQSSGFKRLDDAAMDALRKARFVPYTENGVPQPVWTTAPIGFESED